MGSLVLAHSTCQLKPQTPLFVPGLPHGSQSHHSPGHVWPGRHSCHLHYGAPHDFKHCRNPSHEGHRAAPHLPGPIFRLGTSEMETYSLTHCNGYPMSRKQAEQCPGTQTLPDSPRPQAILWPRCCPGHGTKWGSHTTPLPALSTEPQNKAPKQESLCLHAKKSMLNNISLPFVL